jgi:drug/metabolite transporter (DMT)-like permease
MSADTRRIKSLQMLFLATAFWGLSFPATKALAMAQQQLLPAGSTWFIASLCVVCRFGVAALILCCICLRSRPKLTRLELEQGLGLGLFAGVGILLQVDGMAYTDASTSAFLTQCYCLLIPLWVAWRQHRPPAASVVVSCGMVVVGVAVLARVNWQSLSLGRGEWETIAASIVFTGQILWLERPRYANNGVAHFSLVMFAVMTLVCLPVAFLTTGRPADWLRAYASPATVGLLAILILFCTFGGYLLMNRWQRNLSATEAGLIYCVEPIFASLFALFLPALFSSWAGVAYANETVTAHLVIGGGLITAANVIIQLPRPLTIRRLATGRRCPAAAPERAPGSLDAAREV